jgi:hypothetical protein
LPIYLPAQGDELRADLLDGRAVALAEIGDGFVIRSGAFLHSLDPELT